MDYNLSWIFISLISVIFIFLFVQIAKTLFTEDELGKKTSDGSEIKSNKKLVRYTSIKEIPAFRDIIGKNIIVVYFNHSKCAGCVQLTPKFRFLAKNELYKSRDPPVSFLDINPNQDNIDLTSIGIMFVPTILIFDHEGDLINNFIGLLNGSADLVIQEVMKVLDSLFLQ